jgi:preprotein translocase subunit SecA
MRQAGLLETGTLYDIHNVSLVHHVNSALRAHKLFTRDVDYIVKDDKVVIIDEFTGRMMVGRRYSEGLHQALEAKEHVTIEKENQTLASITFQNYFRMYPKLAGMTGTAMTEAGEFAEIYKLDVVEMPTNRPVARADEDDEVYRTAREKNEAIVALIEEAQKRQQPVLVGTVSIEKSEHLSDLLKKKKIKHAVLNARYHEQEAAIVAQAGRPGAVTIATNMAGRGTDIQLGGNLEMRIRDEADQLEGEAREQKIAALKAEIDAAREVVKEAGGLYVVGTERHESRRIDNQLRGRSGRQGDPGNSKFFLSLEDDLMRIYGMQRMDGVLQRLGIKEGEAIIHPWINKALERAQKKVEEQHFEIRKNLLKYDDVMNEQRKVIYDQRREVMGAEAVGPVLEDMRGDAIERIVRRNLPPHSYAEQWNTAGLKDEVQNVLAMELPIDEWAQEAGIDDETILERIIEAANAKAAQKVETYGADIMGQIERSLLLQLLDQSWKEHLLALDHLRQGINLRAYGQRDPLNEYKREAFQLFSDMLDDVREQVTRYLSNIEFRTEPQDIPPPPQFEMHETRHDPALDMQPGFLLADEGGFAQPGNVALADDQFAGTPRNAPCPCGSGKKYKHCHGAAV